MRRTCTSRERSYEKGEETKMNRKSRVGVSANKSFREGPGQSRGDRTSGWGSLENDETPGEDSL